MARSRPIIGLDIGTQNIKLLVANLKKEEDLEVAFQSQKDARGVRRGVVINPAEVSIVLQELFSQMRQEGGRFSEAVCINIDGSHLFAHPSKGLISVSRADQKISEEDVQRVLQAAEAISLPSNKEIFDVIPREFIIDGERGIKEAAGLQGVRLETEVLVLGGFAPYLENLTQAVLGSEVQIIDRIPSPIAAARACLTGKQKELGVAVADIGAGTTGLAVFEEGNLIHLAILPLGSSNITNDIAIGLRTDIDVAERIKIEFGACLSEKKQKREKIELGEDEHLVFSQKQLVDIIAPRVSEIFGEINKELKRISREKILPAGIVLTGGGAKMPRMVDVAKKELKLPARIGIPQGISGLKDPLWSVCCGLILNGVDLERREKTFGLTRGIGSKIKKIFKVFIP